MTEFILREFKENNIKVESELFNNSEIYFESLNPPMRFRVSKNINYSVEGEHTEIFDRWSVTPSFGEAENLEELKTILSLMFERGRKQTLELDKLEKEVKVCAVDFENPWRQHYKSKVLENVANLSTFEKEQFEKALGELKVSDFSFKGFQGCNARLEVEVPSLESTLLFEISSDYSEQTIYVDYCYEFFSDLKLALQYFTTKIELLEMVVEKFGDQIRKSLRGHLYEP